MRYLSVCSGIEAASVAWAPLGWQPWAFAEIEGFPSAVLKHHYPETPNLGDITKFRDWPDAAIDVLVGGTPCQSFSVAGLRKGLADPRGNLALTYLAIADKYRPEWLVWENVPGVLSSAGGRDFGAFLGGLGQLGYGFAYRVLDAQYCRVDGYERAVPQRRRRVFVVGHLGDWRRAAAVLFERSSLSGDSPPRREAGKGIAPTNASRPTGGGGLGADFDCDGGLIAGTLGCRTTDHSNGMKSEADFLVPSISPALKSRDYKGPSSDGHGDGAPLIVAAALRGNAWADHAGDESRLVAHSLRADGFDASEDGTGRGTPIVPIDMRQASRGDKITNNRRSEGSTGGAPGHGIGEPGDPAFTVSERGQAIAFDARQSDVIQYGDRAGPLDTDAFSQAVAFAENQRAEVLESDTVRSLVNGGGKPGQGYPAIRQGWAVRRLTPRECERLQGFPDDYTLIGYRGKLAADGPRYKALGNSMACNVMRWLGRRIDMVRRIVDGAPRRIGVMVRWGEP